MVAKRLRWQAAVLVLLVMGLIVTYGVGRRIDYYSCQRCRNLQQVRVRTFLAWDVSRRARITTSYPIEEGHVHAWWHYSAYREHDVWGVSRSVACEPSQYVDGWKPPAPVEEPPAPAGEEAEARE